MMLRLGQLLFPKQAPWQQRQKVRGLLYAMISAVVMGGIITACLIWENRKH